MRIDNNQGCPVADCPVDLGQDCKLPQSLKISLAPNFKRQAPISLEALAVVLSARLGARVLVRLTWMAIEVCISSLLETTRLI